MNQAGTLILVCRKCTRESVIPAPTMETAVELAKLRGWVADGEAYICPTCPAIRVTFHQGEVPAEVMALLLIHHAGDAVDESVIAFLVEAHRHQRPPR